MDLDKWENVSAEVCHEMKTNAAFAEENLNHPNPKRRLVALGELGRVWFQSEKLLDICLHRLEFDASHAVRELAAIYLGQFEQLTYPIAGQTLARIIADETEPFKVREGAYRGLLILARPEAPVTDLRIPDDIDWVLVESFRRD